MDRQSTKLKDEHIALIAFVICYIWFYLVPVFGGEKMAYFRYILDMPKIGADLRQMLTYASQIPGNPYIGRNIYPPFAAVLFIPLTWVDVRTAYLLLSMLTLGAYFAMFLQAPKSNVSILIFIGGLVGYGMQFEIERGQWNVIAMCLAMVGMELWRRKARVPTEEVKGSWFGVSRNRVLAFVCLTLAIQLKVWPAIFVLLLDWRENWKPVALLAGINAALLFCLGPDIFSKFYEAMISYKPDVWVGNHSAASFGTVFNVDSTLILAATFLILAAAWFRKNALVACTVAAMLIPSASHDYKLAILALPVALAMNQEAHWTAKLLLMLGYCAILFSYATKPGVLASATLPLLVMMAASLLFKSDARLRGDSNQRGKTKLAVGAVKK